MSGNFYVIGLTGKKGAGKDTAAVAVKAMADTVGDVFMKLAFADPIKRQFMNIVGATTDAEYDHIKRSSAWYQGLDGYNRSISMREVMRGVGMLMRSYDEDQFVDYVRKQINAAHQDHLRRADNRNTYVCVTDVRFANEVALLRREFNATIIKIVDPNDSSTDNHVTEQGLPPYTIDTVVENPRDTNVDIDSVVDRVPSFVDLIAKRVQSFVHPNPHR